MKDRKFQKKPPSNKTEKSDKGHYTLEEILQGIAKSTGSTRSIARIMGVERSTVYKWKERHPEVAEAMTECKKEFKEILQDQFREKVESGDTTSIIFGLKCLCKDEGYVERTEINHQGEIGRGKSIEGLTDEQLAAMLAELERITSPKEDAGRNPDQNGPT